MFNIFGNKKLKIEQCQKIVVSINLIFQSLKLISNDDLREKSRRLGCVILEELNSIDTKINEIEHLLNTDNNVDVLNIIRLYTEIDRLTAERDKQLESTLKNYLPEAFAILKETCRRFSMNQDLIVNATDFDLKIADSCEYLIIDGQKAIYKNKWHAGGKEIVWDMIPYDSQLLTGVVLQFGEIAELLNGEGKTLAATFPLFLNAIAKRKIHVCTANSFLAVRDSQWMKPILEFHGISVSNIEESASNSKQRKEAYQADITYGTSTEFGFDYLRDNMAVSLDDIVQSNLDFVIVDEIDSVLIDEARTPLIISGEAKNQELILPLFESLKPFVNDLITKQDELLNNLFSIAKENFKNQNYYIACWNLYSLKRGNPKFGGLHNYINTTPNVISQLNKFEQTIKIENKLEEIDNQLYFIVDGNTIEIKEKGRKLIIKLTKNPSFWDIPDLELEMESIKRLNLNKTEEIEKKRALIDSIEYFLGHHLVINQLMKAIYLFKINVDYIVQDNKVLIVDEISGRILHGRRYSDGLHQAIEAKESVPLQPMTQSFATISFQAFFQKYKKLAGMTATAMIAENEFKNVYNKSVIQIPPFKKNIRKDYEDIVYLTRGEKLRAIVNETKYLIENNRPVLIGTTNTEDSELISRFLQIRGIPHNVLNAKQDRLESIIIAKAGLPRTVTIAALMAGRGTDIKLTDQSRAAGGLAVIGFERHESRRIDSQLRGRAGRQGDPGSSQFFISLEDNLMRMYGSDRIMSIMDTLGMKKDEKIQGSIVTKSIERAQIKVEENNFGIRSRLYSYDSSLHIAREGIYQKRNHALSGYRLKLDVMKMFDDVSEFIIELTYKKKLYDEFLIQILETFNYNSKITQKEFEQLTKKELIDNLYYESYSSYLSNTKIIIRQAFPVISNVYTTKSDTYNNIVVPISTNIRLYNIFINLEKAYKSSGTETIKELEAQIIIHIIDEHWKKFLKMYDKIKEDISLLTSFEKSDPLIIFKKNIGEYYFELLNDIHFEIVTNLCFAHIPTDNSDNME